ncbi:hypothetical protein F4779DRAFT_159514 [Xylariaceae sp. FL0662B]|nr:hypothetical protein F4779DRAFT_159514 [Xylariaceae sp. FL0662B]
MDKKKKIVYQLDTPYSAVSWPQVTFEDQDTILELLCALLAPLGRYRLEHIQTSKGKRDKKRKRRVSGPPTPSLALPPIPELKNYIDVGLPAITRCLQEIASTSNDPGSKGEGNTLSRKCSGSRFYSAIYVARSGYPNALNGHLPQMVAVASKADPTRVPIRLVGLSKACEERLSESLGIPRVSCIGLREDAPNSKALVDFTRQHVPAIEVSWLEEARLAEHRETNINTIETSMGIKKKPHRG